ncbi:hypothetical protein [Lactococcus lactis]|uniref:Uncharacterized protein n=1 Tax=Lactococcus lactis TaxID=1358 RepID=A0AAP3Z0G3_9LACT|nr:hypothetical protein [Lactococcus lactis]MDG4976093.1 hypothetical protein [Lactococcus lactis]
MKISKIEEVGYLLTAYDEDRHALYTAEQMQEYAKECVIASLREYVGPYSDKKANSIISRVVK